jgi:hypothetical protein
MGPAVRFRYTRVPNEKRQVYYESDGYSFAFRECGSVEGVDT